MTSHFGSVVLYFDLFYQVKTNFKRPHVVIILWWWPRHYTPHCWSELEDNILHLRITCDVKYVYTSMCSGCLPHQATRKELDFQRSDRTDGSLTAVYRVGVLSLVIYIYGVSP